MPILHFYKTTLASSNELKATQTTLNSVKLLKLNKEVCFNVKVKEILPEEKLRKLKWILAEPFYGRKLSVHSTFTKEVQNEDATFVFEVGPRLSFSTPLCTNAVSICHNAGLFDVIKIEESWCYELHTDISLNKQQMNECINSLHDPMTQCRYFSPLDKFGVKGEKESWKEIDVLNEGEAALMKANVYLGLGFDLVDMEYYTSLFKNKIKRNPTTVECFDLAQSNSEHSRHWFFNGRIVIDDVEQSASLFSLVKNTIAHSNNNNVIAFKDNSSAIKGFEIPCLTPQSSYEASIFKIEDNLRHITLTAETHNFPTGVSPFPGATTGTGGRQRDQHAAGRGSNIIAGTAGYCVGNLNLDDHPLSWEDNGSWPLPSNLASARNISIAASDGASDYGNKFGEPVITGFFRSFGAKLPNGERREWLKPIMFSGGVGSIDHRHVNKMIPTADDDLLVGKIGGPAYRIGVGGGCASSVDVHGDNTLERDFDAVQRGDAQMQQKLNRAIRACIETGTENPIMSIHDQGAGGNGNVLKEIVEPAGATIYAKSFKKADDSMSIMELWAAEYQESDAVLFKKDSLDKLKKICDRERCPLDVVGKISGDGQMVLDESEELSLDAVPSKKSHLPNKRHPVDLNLEYVLGKMPQKTYRTQRTDLNLSPITIPQVSIKEMLCKVLSLPSVGSKRFLTTKVDRSVTGLIAQQQCVGPLHTPLADVAITILSNFTTKGIATAIGEQPIKMLVDPKAGARLAVAEALTNLVFVVVSDIRDIKCSANWMWPAKLPGEAATIYDACASMCKVMHELRIAVDGGKDSLSMAARVKDVTVKCPGSLVISLYAPCPDVTKKVTPDLKGGRGKQTNLIHIPMTACFPHLGGSALAQCYNQVGDVVPDLSDVQMFVKAWKLIQELIAEGKILSGHDISDGGLIVTLLEMAFAGNCGMKVDISTDHSRTNALFAEIPGVVLEAEDKDEILLRFHQIQVPAVQVGHVSADRTISFVVNGDEILNDEVSQLRDIWESTSFTLDKLQCNHACVDAERNWLLRETMDPPHQYQFTIPASISPAADAPRVAIIREEGSNGDREMAAAFYKAGFQTWDVAMEDLLKGGITLEGFRGIALVGGFSYADVFGSAKGWAACSLFNDNLRKQLDHFRSRGDTFSLGICNGCQLMAHLGWIGTEEEGSSEHNDGSPSSDCYLAHNTSGRYESRYVSVVINSSPSIMLQGMEGGQLGVWVAHGEGKFTFKEDSIGSSLLKHGLVPVQYIDHQGKVTQQYPLNPNGSPYGIAGICSANGRHLAMMPHPERSADMSVLPWCPPLWGKCGPAPWQRMFCNAFDWCNEEIDH